MQRLFFVLKVSLIVILNFTAFVGQLYFYYLMKSNDSPWIYAAAFSTAFPIIIADVLTAKLIKIPKLKPIRIYFLFHAGLGVLFMVIGTIFVILKFLGKV